MQIGRNLKYFGKYIDQPLVLDKINKAVPPVLIGGATAYALHDAYHNHKDAPRKNLIKNASTLAFTVVGSLAGLRGLKIGGKEIIKRFIHVHSAKEVKAANTKIVDNFLKHNKVGKKVKTLLEKAKTKPLKKKEIMELEEKLTKFQPEDLKGLKLATDGTKTARAVEGDTSSKRKALFDKLFPPPEDVDFKHAKHHVASLSWLGFLPVVGGILGGVIGDKITEKNNWKQGVPNKIKEGAYQYLANIFLCNVGALGALWGLNKLQKAGKIKTVNPIAKAGAMVAGIMATGVIGGSFIANVIGQKIINPLFGDNRIHKRRRMHQNMHPDMSTRQKNMRRKESVYHERVPEALDIALHVDDIATVGVLSGLKWIEPALPLMYAVSGYRAGMGYRNHHIKNHCHKGKCQSQPNREMYFRHMKNNPAFISFNSNTKITNKESLKNG